MKSSPRVKKMKSDQSTRSKRKSQRLVKEDNKSSIIVVKRETVKRQTKTEMQMAGIVA